jgi:uncharacterized membrane protein
MTLLRRYWLAIVFLGCAFFISGIGYAWLPARIAVHWNQSGQADAWMAKQVGAFILPTIGLMLTAILIVVAPKGTSRVEPDTTPKVYATIVGAIAAVPLYATIAVVGVGVGLELNVISYTTVGIGVLLMVLGNALGKTRRNAVLGVRTPWTLASEEVWSATNRLTGWLLVLGGIVTIVGGLAGRGTIVMACVVTATAVIATVYSYTRARLSS